ncbi:SusC/RagA family TonB-linked outer membrane protein [Runella zeae]|uniref:SusC/RagA family TonB-linked outer membrane protein n=1 Tax=Runella zeae TaxID=94255 RepID=UPI00040F1844|nr:STN domain-containing protein [Runella zeae]
MKKTLTHKRLLYRIVQTSLLQIFIAILFSGITLATPVKGQEMLERKVSIHVSDLPLGQVLKSLEKSAQVKFSFNSRTLNLNQNVSVNATNETLTTILTKILKPLNISHIQVSNRIVLRKEESAKVGLLEEPLLPTIILPVDQSISGTVTDETGMGLPGVSVLVKETASTTRQRGTTTDPNGKYKIDIPEGEVFLVFSFVGYLPQEVQVGNQTQINVSLKVDTKTLDEVVVTAFGIKREQKALGYASQKIGGEQLSSVGNASIQNSLQGKAAGVQVRLSSGMPGRPAQINIRGSRSITGSNEPLYVIDGLPVTAGSRSIDFNPSDVESMDILKGPAAAALYGVRASNGVIVITTKSGKNASRKPVITFESQFAQDKVSFLPKLQYEYAQGNNGVFDQNALFAFGPKINSIGTYPNLLGESFVPKYG